jgi:hypothetical protein
MQAVALATRVAWSNTMHPGRQRPWPLLLLLGTHMSSWDRSSCPRKDRRLLHKRMWSALPENGSLLTLFLFAKYQILGYLTKISFIVYQDKNTRKEVTHTAKAQYTIDKEKCTKNCICRVSKIESLKHSVPAPPWPTSASSTPQHTPAPLCTRPTPD